MLANFFGKSKPINFVIILGLFVIYFLFENYSYSSVLESEGFWVNFIDGFLLYFVLFFFYNFLIIKNKLTKENAYSFLCYVFFLSFFPKVFVGYKTVLVAVLLLLFLRKVYSLHSMHNVYEKIFNSALLLGITFIFDSHALIFGLLIYVSVLIFYNLTFRALLIPILGFVLPVFFYYVYSVWFEKTEAFYELFTFNLEVNYSLFDNNLFLVPFIIISVLATYMFFTKSIRTMSVSDVFRKKWTLLAFNAVVALFYLLFSTSRYGQGVMHLLFPLSIIIANGIEIMPKKWMKETVLLLFFLMSVVEVFYFQFL